MPVNFCLPIISIDTPGSNPVSQQINRQCDLRDTAAPYFWSLRYLSINR
ncbi:unknown protein [Desulfotalea psychrophila LSv54]|uniref:Uncharacterized protein n=1 Tax=Desulfotalea psychrophila (strain LSv54 / DSM 12343) TaxID=177439 RepID=Q6AKD4_DESPS|nr:unknown protein [Desulfotalea psychrophila LSv54]